MEKTRIKELNIILKKANDDYYGKNSPTMSDKEYDSMYDELVNLEKIHGQDEDSVTKGVNTYNFNPLFTKVGHRYNILSLDKTKDTSDIDKMAEKNSLCGTLKLDGLTLVAEYKHGILNSLVTRGDGYVGEDVTSNHKLFKQLPLKLAGEYRNYPIATFRGEALISYEEFDRINVNNEYKNPRNLASGLLRNKNPEMSNVLNFLVYETYEAGNETIIDDFSEIENIGFESVKGYIIPKGYNSKNVFESIEEDLKSFPFPTDGVVFRILNNKEASALGVTGKFPKHSIAFKWNDDVVETVLKGVEWTIARTGAITPVALFEPVELEGTTVERASVHNISTLKSLKLGIGDTVSVYKANMIIPQIYENLVQSDSLEIPTSCPACHGDAEVNDNNGVQVLYCTNPDCIAKHVSSLELFVSRSGMNIDGLSIKTLETLISLGYIKNYLDIYKLKTHKEELEKIDRFGEKSVNNLIESIEKSKDVNSRQVIRAIGVPLIGERASRKMFSNLSKDELSELINLNQEELREKYGLGDVASQNMINYFGNSSNSDNYISLLDIVKIEEVNKPATFNKSLEKKVFVITGKLKTMSRKELIQKIEENGGTVSSSVSKNTNYLINNDVSSTSGKNKQAKNLGVPIINEEEILKMI